MGCDPYTCFKLVNNIGQPLLSNELEANFRSFVDWGLLNIGGWTNITVPTSGIHGGSFHSLRNVVDANFTDGQVWQSAHKNWVYETGVRYSTNITGSLSNISISGSSGSINIVTTFVSPGNTLTISNSSGALNQDYEVVALQVGYTYLVKPTNAITGTTTSGNWSLSYSPITNIDIYTNNILTPTGDYYIDYPLGRVVFNTPISTTSVVHAKYSYKNIYVDIANNVPWFTQFQTNSLRPDDIQYTQNDDCGEWSIAGQHRVQIPCIVIECVPRSDSIGYELGNGALKTYQDVVFYVFADNRHDRNQLLDILRYQAGSTIWLYSTQFIANTNSFGLDYRGSRNITGLNYSDIVSNPVYRWKTCFILNANSNHLDMIHTNLFVGVVRARVEVVLGSV